MSFLLHYSTDFNLKQYAVDLVNNEIPDFTNEFCEIGIFEKVIKKVLIHRGVDTPRQVKRIINKFITPIISTF